MNTTLIAAAVTLILAASFATTNVAAARSVKVGGVASIGAAKKLGCHWGKDANGNLVLICS